MLIQHIIENAAQKFPDKKAIWYNGEWMVYSDIDLKSSKIANFLKESGVRRGERIALLSENSFFYIICYYAILKADAVVVALNTELVADSWTEILNHCTATGIIISSKFIEHLHTALDKVTSVRFLVTEKLIPGQLKAQFKGEMATLQSIENQCITKYYDTKSINIDLSSIIYTSGSTGKPKGVMLSHLNITENTASIVQYLQLSSKDRMMVVLPFYYVYGNTLFNTHFRVGGSIVIDNHFAFPNLILETMKIQRVTGFSGVPSTFMILLNKSNIKKYIPFENLRLVTQAGGNMSISVQESVVNIFAPAKLFVMYGATELSPRLTWLPPEKWHKKKGSIGISIPNTEAFIADENGTKLPAGCEGEIVGRGSNVMMGYWKDPESTSLVLHDGLYHTGDIGRIDDEGYIYIIGRSKEMLKIGGNRVSTKEIEDAILQVEHIIEVAVVGVSDSLLGEVAKAFIVKKDNAEIEEVMIRQFLRSKLAAYKIPKYFEFCDLLPKNEAGKIMKQKLKKTESN